MEEKEYRRLVDLVFQKTGKAFDGVDPDEAEFELSQGAVTILFKNGTRLILSTQPSVSQIWLAAASKGIAFHFNYDTAGSRWVDDKGKGIELYACLRDLTLEASGVKLAL